MLRYLPENACAWTEVQPLEAFRTAAIRVSIANRGVREDQPCGL